MNNKSCVICLKEIPGDNGPGMVFNCCGGVCHCKCWYDNKQQKKNCPVCKQFTDT